MITTNYNKLHPRLDDVILKYADESPNKTAIRFEDREISFAELNKRVNALAFYLYTAGVSSEKFVAVLLDPSEDIVVAMLAIFRLGAIYAPLDPMHPDTQIHERQDAILPVITLTQSHYKERVEKLGLTSVYVDEMAGVEVPSNIRLESKPDDPACIFFTSGSTGKPKGVLGSYAALSASIIEPSNHLGLTGNDVLDSIARYAWSISMLELMAALVHGGTTLILDRKNALDLEWLSARVRACTAFHCPPALLKSLAEYVESEVGIEAFSNIQLVWYGGDSFEYRSIEMLQRVFPNARVATAYGTTEIFGLSHCHFYSRNSASSKVLIGEPVGSMTQLLLDPKGAPVGDGQVGELYIGGPRLALEYYGQPDLNKEKFPCIDGERYFSTGDFAQLDTEGNLEYLQRTDDQLKVRGIRIDLREINFHLRSHESVKESVIIAKDDGGGSKELHAFVILVDEAISGVDVIRKFLVSALPDYMIPSSITALEKFPYTENFKIDKKSLGSLEVKTSAPEISGVDKTTSKIARLWFESGKVVAASADDNFFEVGGNSMSAIALVSAIKRELHLRIEVADIYRYPTLKRQAEFLSAKGRESSLGLSESEARGSFAQVGLFFREMFERRDKSITCTRYVIRSEGFDDDLIRKSLVILIDRYKTLRTTVKPSKGSLQLTLQEPPSEDGVLMERLPGVWSLSGGSEVRAFIKQDYKFNLGRGPLLAALCCQLDTGGDLLQLSAHHIAADDNSTGRIAKDFIDIYNALLKGEDLSLVPVESEYDDFLLDQQDRADSGFYDQRAKEIGERLLFSLERISNKPLIASVAGSESQLDFSIVLDQVRSAGASFVDVVSAFSWVLYHSFGRENFVFCAHVAMRRDSDEDPQVGMFVNLVPVFLTVNPANDFERHSDQVRKDFEYAMSNSDVPYELIIHSQEDLRRLGRFPFDGFVNELRFEDKYPEGYQAAIIPRSFSTDGGEISLSLIRTCERVELKLESPGFEGGKRFLAGLAEKTAETLYGVDRT
ncbi:non-ribosomal peptide synthetase [Microbulbifer aggregans]|uniref:non-ribosomal peptide synthetase n=1 Tax=Microbulbifer aggregans TaxID=1769779 RepID=UPI001CFC695E|nr:non-ribosomal peptide synthetase [Microbulbifer aggregans]